MANNYWWWNEINKRNEKRSYVSGVIRCCKCKEFRKPLIQYGNVYYCQADYVLKEYVWMIPILQRKAKVRGSYAEEICE